MSTKRKKGTDTKRATNKTIAKTTNSDRNYGLIVQFRVGAEARAKYKRLCKKSGLTMSDAFRRYVKGLRDGENLQ